ncbi:PH domain-containing protein [Erythrobacter crassostreae]|uniref:PH domain-containing protein n=1 Tax=Erythrobacter crassostreae TaxID=2828328 RepID=A0A9X1F197_9SPHN|nr:PH domain-containing protein [Erythrobacter crassostrea]MBV7258462.1 PH domain-containing protein [Erythrobacter crassostrea]
MEINASEPIVPAASALVDDDAELTQLHPNYRSALRVQATLTSIPFIIGAFVLEGALQGESPLPFGVLIGVVVFLALVFIIRLPSRRYAARGYQISTDRLRVVRGILWRSDTVVPFGRVQHIDVDQGPIDRFFDIATLTLHTAGSHNASVYLPGLGHELATEMREEIRAHIKRESM